MLLLIALHGCGEVGPIETVEVKPAPDALASAADLRIATAPERGLVARAPVLASALPVGEPIVRDCFGGRVAEFKGRGNAGPIGAPATGSAPPPAPTPTARPAAKPRPPEKRDV